MLLGTCRFREGLKVEEELCACPYLTLADRLTFCRRDLSAGAVLCIFPFPESVSTGHKSKRTGDEWLAARHGYGHHPNWPGT